MTPLWLVHLSRETVINDNDEKSWSSLVIMKYLVDLMSFPFFLFFFGREENEETGSYLATTRRSEMIRP